MTGMDSKNKIDLTYLIITKMCFINKYEESITVKNKYVFCFVSVCEIMYMFYTALFHNLTFSSPATISNILAYIW